MPEDELRARVANDLKAANVSDALWNRLSESGYVSAVLAEPTIKARYRELLMEARALRKIGHSQVTAHKPVPGRESGVYAEAHYRPDERLRRDALTCYLARM